MYNFLNKVANRIVSIPIDIRYRCYKNKYNVHPSFRFNGRGIIFHGNGNINIGKESYLDRHSYLQSKEKNSINIGNNVSISHFVYMYTTSSFADQDFTQKYTDEFKIINEDIDIGNNSWIGTKVFINPGISIGENTVIGANSVVTKNIPPHCIAVGAPAKVIKFKSYLSDKEEDKLIKDYKDVLAGNYNTK
jgi:acetyltransferase-like isoleucine patch superfamily enzyme